MHSGAGTEVLVMGAGAVGCFIGGSLVAAGVPVRFVGRPRVLQALRSHGLTLSDLEGGCRRVAPDVLQLADEVPADVRPALVLLTVKSPATPGAAAELGAKLPPGTPVLSLQNGVSNVGIAQQAAPQLRVLPGVVPYNIAELGPGAYHRGTAGRLLAQADAALAPWADCFSRACVPLEQLRDLQALQWGKLLINLNNAVNALAGLPLRAQLLDRRYRRCFAALLAEALAVLERSGIEPARVIALSPRRLITVLQLPDLLFRGVAARMLRIDAHARTSMADDVARGRRTEVDALCGEVVRLANANGLQAPRNAKMVELLDGLWPEPPHRLSPQALCDALGLRH